MSSVQTAPSAVERPDNWVETLTAVDKHDDPLTDLAELLSGHVRSFNLKSPRIVLGHNIGVPALDSVRQSCGLTLADIDSFSLSGDKGIDGETVEFPTVEAWKAADGVICLDPTPATYLNAIQFCFDNGIDLPVIADFGSMPGQFCQLSALSGETFTDIYIYNYFTRLYRVKDPLQLLWRVNWIDGPSTTGTRILGPNQNIHFSPRDLAPPTEASKGTMIYEARHPAFARVPNNRFRGYVDVISPSFCASLHGDEIEAKRSEKGKWFDTYVAPLGGGHDISLVVRNDCVAPEEVTLNLMVRRVGTEDVQHLSIKLGSDCHELEISLAEYLGMTEAAIQTEVVASIEGRSYRLEWKEHWTGLTGQMCYQSNHGSTNDIALLDLVQAKDVFNDPDPVLYKNICRMSERNIMPLPYPLPVLPRDDRYVFSFSAGKFLPHIDHVDVAAFDRQGQLIGRDRMGLPENLDYVSAADTPFADALEEGGLMLISPPYVEKGMVPYQNCREDLWIRLSDFSSGDSDIAEFQMHNRNLRGYTIPIGFGQAPQMIKARTELMIRFRCDGQFDTRLLLLNTSPELDFNRAGEVELEFNLPDGSSSSSTITLQPHCWEFHYISSLLPANIRGAEYGWVRVISDTLALSAYAALEDRHGGRLGFQHLLGA